MSVTKEEAQEKKKRVLNYPGLHHLIEVLDSRYGYGDTEDDPITNGQIDSILYNGRLKFPRGDVDIHVICVTNSEIEEIFK